MTAKKKETVPTFVNLPPHWAKGWLTPSYATMDIYQRDTQELPKLVDSKAPAFRRRTPPIRRDEVVWGSVGRVVRELEATDDRLRAHGRYSAAITAVQIARPLRLALVHLDDERYVLANPQITDRNGHETRHESCLSLPDMAAEVTRAARIRLHAVALHTNEAGVTEAEPFSAYLSGANVATVEHACDHLTGDLFTRCVTRQHHKAVQVPPTGVCGEYVLPALPSGEYIATFPKEQLVAFSAGEISLGDCVIRQD